MPNEIGKIKPMPAGTPGPPGFVLVVDDEEQNRTLLRDPCIIPFQSQRTQS
jgi:hypothetical protein